MEAPRTYSMGWLPDRPDFRDWHSGSAAIMPLLEKANVAAAVGKLPEAADLRAWCSPVEDQGQIGSCTANAGVGAVEYFEKRAFGKHIDASRLFLYKATRDLAHITGDNGAFLRSTMGALALFGVPPEEYWPYAEGDVDKDPPAFCYAFAQNYQALNYFRLDTPEAPPAELLDRIKTNLAAGLPSIFGFTVYTSVSGAADTGQIPYPAPGEKIAGGHAVVAVGFDDKLKIKPAGAGGQETAGALLIRNSWGSGWGEAGYGWLPYQYVLSGLAIDWWALIKSEWIDTGLFKL